MLDLVFMILCNILILMFLQFVLEWQLSMGAVLLTAGEKGKRTALKHSRVMIHQPLGGGPVDKASDIEITAKEIQKLKKELYEIILITLRQTTKKCGKMEIEIIG